MACRHKKLKEDTSITSEASRFLPIVLTIGHSTRGIEEFISLLQAHGVTRVVDVRTVPRSRPQSAVRQDLIAKNAAESRDRIYSPIRAGRLAPRPARFDQSGMAKCIFPGVCGLHADAGL